MALLNPVYALLVPFIFVITVPLAVFAGITTMLAFAVLILRVVVVYLDIALSLLPQYLFAPSKLRYADAASRSPSPTAIATSLRRRRRRPSSVSAGSLTPIARADSTLGLFPSVGAERDFEGLGGWRVGEDDAWTRINSRSELPDRGHHYYHHQRSASGGGPTTPGEGGYLMMKARTRSPEDKAAGRKSASPNSSRARTPSGSRVAGAGKMPEGYFPMTAPPQKGKKAAA